MILLCPLCGDADDVVRPSAADEVLTYRCVRNSKWHPDNAPYTWIVPKAADGPTRPVRGLSVRDTGLAAALQACVLPGEGWVEYGVVEHRYAERHPDAFGRLVAEYGHVWRGADRPEGHDRQVRSTDMTASRYLVRTLSALAKADLLCNKFGRGTGAWNRPSISYWAVPPAPADHHELTYESFIQRMGEAA